MFFLGSTGPLLTVLLTILLPFFLLTAKQHERVGLVDNVNPIIQKVHTYFGIKQIKEKTTIQKKSLPFYNFLFLKWQLNCTPEPFQNYFLLLKKLQLSLNDSGNKAPPVKS